MEQSVFDLVRVLGLSLGLRHHRLGLLEDTAELFLQLDELFESVLADLGELEQPHGVARGSSIKDDQVVVEFVDLIEHLTKCSGFIDAWHGFDELLQEVATGLGNFLTIFTFHLACTTEHALSKGL